MTRIDGSGFVDFFFDSDCEVLEELENRLGSHVSLHRSAFGVGKNHDEHRAEGLINEKSSVFGEFGEVFVDLGLGIGRIVDW